MIDRRVFFDAVRARPFGGSLSQSQVDGMIVLLDVWERDYKGRVSLPQLAYCLGTAFHETARAMQPVIETRQPGEAQNPSVDAAIGRLDRAYAAGRLAGVSSLYWRKDKDGKSWLGRGQVQLTHKENYEKMGRVIGVDLVTNPDRALEPIIGAHVLFAGMMGGLFRPGHALGKYVNASTTDFIGARQVVNGDMKRNGKLIADHAVEFLGALKAAEKPAIPHVPKPTPPAPVPPVAPAPAPGEPVARTPNNTRPGKWQSFFAALIAAFFRR